MTLNDAFNPALLERPFNSFRISSTLYNSNAVGAAEALASFQQDFIEKAIREAAGLTWEKEEKKRKADLIGRACLPIPKKAYQQAAVRETATTKLTGTQEYEDASARGQRVMEDKEAGRLTELMTKPEAELEGDDAKDYAIIKQRGIDKAGEIGAAGIETPEALTDDAEAKTKAVELLKSPILAH